MALLTLALTLALAALGGSAGGASAEEGEESVTFPGTPLSVSVGYTGQCQSSYPEHGDNFYPPGGTLGDCGLILAFPTPKESKFTGQPKALEGKTYTFTPLFAGEPLPTVYTPVSHSAVTGSGTSASPYSQTTVFKVEAEEESEMREYAEIADTTTYVNGEPQFTSTYVVKNITKPEKKIYFRAIYEGDLFLLGSDFGYGVFLGGPPRFIGGQNPASGSLGGFVEAPGLPWSAFQEGCWNDTASEDPGRCSEAAATDLGMWHAVRTTDEEPTAFNDTIDPANIDNAAGVEWDQYRETGLEPKKEAVFSIINRTQIPNNLVISPVNQTLTQGQTETLTVTATDLTGIPYAGKVLHYTVVGSNPQSGTVTLNSAGQAQVSYVGNNAGADEIQMFVDLTGSGAQTAGDPQGTARVTWLPKPPPPPVPNSTYKIQSIKVNSNGTITITFVPVQNGTATVEVTVPTATISRREAEAAKKKKKCKKGQVRIKGKCKPASTLSGKVSATGLAGVPLTITVKASSKVTKALKKGRTVVLTVKLSYSSSLGGAPTTQVLVEKIKPKKKKHHKK